MRIKITAELPVPVEIRPAVGTVLEAVKSTLDNGREAYIVSGGGPQGATQFAVMPEECEVLEEDAHELEV